MARISPCLLAGFTIAGACLATAAHAQSAPVGTWPERTVRIIVGFPPGQATDTTARLIADKLTTRLGQSVIVENRPGQAGSIALAGLKRAPADGYTLGLAAVASLATNPHLYKSLGYDPLADFTPVSIIGSGPLLLLANADMPFSTVKGFVDHAKAHPGKLNYCSTGNGTISHLAMELFARKAGLSLTHVPYQGSAKAMGDLATGEVSVCFDTIGASQPMLRTGKIKVLGVATLQRLELLPDVPTLSESGYKDFEAAPYIGMLVPAGTPSEVVDRMYKELREIGTLPDIQQALKNTGTVSVFSSPGAFSEQLRADFEKWRAVIHEADIRLN